MSIDTAITSPFTSHVIWISHGQNYIPIDGFNAARSLSLRDVMVSGRLAMRGRRPSLQIIQRWANPKRGYAPIGREGPVLVLPTVISGREKLTMPEWVDWFIAERRRIIVEHTRKLVVPATDTEVARNAARAMERMQKRGVG